MSEESQVAAEVAAGTGLTLAAAAKLLPGRKGRPVSPQTLMRWVYAGVKALDGRKVKLEAARVGSSWTTIAGAIRRFVEALSVPTTPQQPSRPAEAAAKRAGAELERLCL